MMVRLIKAAKDFRIANSQCKITITEFVCRPVTVHLPSSSSTRIFGPDHRRLARYILKIKVPELRKQNDMEEGEDGILIRVKLRHARKQVEHKQYSQIGHKHRADNDAHRSDH